MALIVKWPWTRQPQVAAGIDWGNPIARGLAFAANAATGIDHVSGAVGILSGSSFKTVGPAGLAFSTPLTQSAGAWTFAVNIPATFDCTLVIASRGLVGQAILADSAAVRIQSAESVDWRATGSQCQFSSTGNASTVVTGLTVGETCVLAGTKRGNVQDQYVNGVFRTTSVTGNRLVGAATSVSFGRPGGLTNLEKQQTLVAFYFTRALSAAEIKSISDNPWQLFAPLPRRIWAPASSSAPTVAFTAVGETAAVSATASGGTLAGLAATGSTGAFAGTANSVSSVTVAAAGSTGALSASAGASASATLAVSGASGSLAGSAFSSAVVSAAIAGGAGVFAAIASVPATVAMAATGASGAFSASAAGVAGSPSLGGAYFDVLSGRLMILRKR